MEKCAQNGNWKGGGEQGMTGLRRRIRGQDRVQNFFNGTSAGNFWKKLDKKTSKIQICRGRKQDNSTWSQKATQTLAKKACD